MTAEQAETAQTNVTDGLAFLMERYNSFRWLEDPDCDEEEPFAGDESPRDVRDRLMEVYR